MTVELTEEEKSILKTGWLGLTRMDAVKASRGTTSASTAEEKILHAIGAVQVGQPGAQSVALNALEAALREIRSKGE